MASWWELQTRVVRLKQQDISTTGLLAIRLDVDPRVASFADLRATRFTQPVKSAAFEIPNHP